MKRILFFSPYPEEHKLKDGMISRIKCIDDQFKDFERNYLLITFSKKSSIKEFENAKAYVLNVFTHLFLVIKLIQHTDLIYCQSIYSIATLWPAILFKGKREIVLDVHGVVPEEELYFHKKWLKSKYLSFVERIIFKRLDYAICVTNQMIDVYKDKYHNKNCKYILFFITPAELINKKTCLDTIESKSEKVEVIYTGGVQQWQNVDRMLQYIKNNLAKNVHYTILSGNADDVKQKIKDLDINQDSIYVGSCQPYELESFYKKAHYAFILRDDSVVNHVANPTKLIEYLFYGLTPIVLCPNIGDYKTLGYEYINVEEFNASKLFSHKSSINSKIAMELIADNIGLDLKSKLGFN